MDAGMDQDKTSRPVDNAATHAGSLPGPAGAQSATASATPKRGMWRMLPPAQSPNAPVTSMPFEREAAFVGRQERVAQIRGLLEAGGRAVLATNDGAGRGVGTTTLALEYAYRFAASYGHVWWLHAEEPAVLAGEYARLAQLLELPESRKGDQQAMIGAAHARLAGHRDWLLVFDDVASVESIDRFVPETPGGHIIFVSSAGAPGEDGASSPCILVEPFSQDEAADYVSARTGRREGAEVLRLAELLGYRPLSLAIAAGCMSVSGMSCRDCREAILKRMESTGADVGPEPSDAAALRAAVRVAIDLVAGRQPAALDLTALLSFLGPDAVPLALLRDGAAFLPRRLGAMVRQGGERDAAIELLCRFGLVRRAVGFVSMHRDVQEAVRQALGGDQRRACAQTGLRVLSRAFPFEERYDHFMPGCAQLVGHALAVCRHTEELGVALDETGALLNQAGLYLHGCGEFIEAAACHRGAVRIGESVHGPVHPKEAIRLNNLGASLHALGDLAAARDCYERALAISEQAGDAPEDAVAMPARNLCNVLVDMGDYQAAREAYGRLMDIYMAAHGWNHPLVAEVLCELGRVWRAIGRLPKARKCLESAIMAEEEAGEPGKRALATYCNDLGVLLLELDEPAEAAKQFRRALQLDQAECGERSASVARDAANLAHALRQTKHYPEAQSLLERALDIYENEEGTAPERIAHVLGQLGKIHMARKEFRKAAGCFERAATIREAQYGADAPEVVDNVLALARALEDSEAYPEARARFEQALAIQESTQGREHSSVTSTLNRIGVILVHEGRAADALKLFQRSLATDTALGGTQHVDVARDMHHIGLALHALGDGIGALANLSRALSIYEAAFGKSHAKTVKVATMLEEIGSG
ncbi:MAG: tetratricopeptide repeat protein [Candidatus Hydrogenedentes bacterium]|nr:tetratricopeptide repeat protein [Candidatus Hydrogenedentota bacterium]